MDENQSVGNRYFRDHLIISMATKVVLSTTGRNYKEKYTEISRSRDFLSIILGVIRFREAAGK